jgi:phage regulator Rha-like protein
MDNEKKLLLINDNVYISSLLIANISGKYHSNIMRKIRKDIKDFPFSKRKNKILVRTYKDRSLKNNNYYLLEYEFCKYIIRKYSNNIKEKILL